MMLVKDLYGEHNNNKKTPHFSQDFYSLNLLLHHLKHWLIHLIQSEED